MKRREAFDAGLSSYSSGEPCKNGHLSERLTLTGACIACTREKQREYRKDNPEKMRAYRSAYRAKTDPGVTSDFLKQARRTPTYEANLRNFAGFVQDGAIAADVLRSAIQKTNEAYALVALGDALHCPRIESQSLAQFRDALNAALDRYMVEGWPTENAYKTAMRAKSERLERGLSK